MAWLNHAELEAGSGRRFRRIQREQTARHFCKANSNSWPVGSCAWALPAASQELKQRAISDNMRTYA